jgi:hypothetical protein
MFFFLCLKFKDIFSGFEFCLESFSAPKTDNTLGIFRKVSKLHTNNTSGTDFESFLKIPNVLSVLGAENDSKQNSNPLKISLNFKHKKKNISNMNYILNNSNLSNRDIEVLNPSSVFSSTVFNTENNLKFKDYKSSNSQFLGSERTVRLLDNLNSSSYK